MKSVIKGMKMPANHRVAIRTSLATGLVLAGPVVAGAAIAPVSSSALDAPNALVEQPRSTGYFVGDSITQRVLLETAGHTLSPASLPASARVNAWFERRRASIETDPFARRWLIVQYQVLNAPPKLLTVTLPAWQLTLESTGSPGIAALKIPAVSINISPLSVPGSPAQVGSGDLRPDRLPPLIPTAPLRRAIAFCASALILTVAVWLGWMTWRNRRAMTTQPFAHALREMRALEDHEPQAWRALHRAFDRTAGCVIQSSTLPELFASAPQLVSARAQIERFFAQSSLIFFATTSPPGAGQLVTGAEPRPENARLSAVPGPAERPQTNHAIKPRALCADLRRIERRYER